MGFELGFYIQIALRWAVVDEVTVSVGTGVGRVWEVAVLNSGNLRKPYII